MPSRAPALSISEKLKKKKLKERKEKRKKKIAALDELDFDVHGPLIEDFEVYSWNAMVIQKVREEDDVLNDFDKISLQTPVEFETFTCDVSKPTEAMEAADLRYVFDLFQLKPLATKYKKGDTLIIVKDFSKVITNQVEFVLLKKLKKMKHMTLK